MQTVLTGLILLLAGAGMSPAPWRTIAPGMEIGTFAMTRSSETGDPRITVVRIDPDLWDLEFTGVSRTGGSTGRTAREWSEEYRLAASINAGMFGEDYRTHIGYLRFREHVNNAAVNVYRSVAAFDPRREGLPRFRIFDLDLPEVSMDTILQNYASAIQNLRLIKRPGENRWSPQDRKWSEAALGEDDAGKILFIFCRSPLAMHELNRELLGIGIGLVCAQHLEGGPEAQLYVHVGDEELELWGSSETSFNENDTNGVPWPVPNVLGVRPRASAPK
jgi:hypothetical protein